MRPRRRPTPRRGPRSRRLSGPRPRRPRSRPETGFRRVVSGGATPMASNRSRGVRSGRAPTRSRVFGPTESTEKILPGTARTSRPSSIARRAVINAPDRAAASTTTVARDSPARMRLRSGKWCFRGGVPGGYSVISAPSTASSAANPACSRRVHGVGTGSPHRPTAAAGVKRAPVGLRIDAARHARDRDHSGARQLLSQEPRDLAPVRGRFSRADDRDCRRIGEVAADEKTERWIDHGCQRFRIFGIAGDQPPPSRCSRTILHRPRLGPRETPARLDHGRSHTAGRKTRLERTLGRARSPPPAAPLPRRRRGEDRGETNVWSS